MMWLGPLESVETSVRRSGLNSISALVSSQQSTRRAQLGKTPTGENPNWGGRGLGGALSTAQRGLCPYPLEGTCWALNSGPCVQVGRLRWAGSARGSQSWVKLGSRAHKGKRQALLGVGHKLTRPASGAQRWGFRDTHQNRLETRDKNSAAGSGCRASGPPPPRGQEPPPLLPSLHLGPEKGSNLQGHRARTSPWNSARRWKVLPRLEISWRPGCLGRVCSQRTGA